LRALEVQPNRLVELRPQTKLNALLFAIF
jgi:hypothetical protein